LLKVVSIPALGSVSIALRCCKSQQKKQRLGMIDWLTLPIILWPKLQKQLSVNM